MGPRRWLQKLQPERRSEGGQKLEDEDALGLFLLCSVEARESHRTTREYLLLIKVNGSTRIPKGKRCYIPVTQINEQTVYRGEGRMERNQ